VRGLSGLEPSSKTGEHALSRWRLEDSGTGLVAGHYLFELSCGSGWWTCDWFNIARESPPGPVPRVPGDGLHPQRSLAKPTVSPSRDHAGWEAESICLTWPSKGS